jgi:hypothetical protein
MGVKVKEWKGAFWIFINHQGQRKAKRVGTGPARKKAAELAAIKIQARLVEGETTIFREAAPLPSRSGPTPNGDWRCMRPRLASSAPPGRMS